MDLNQVTVETRDLAESAAFYQRLGLKRIVWSAPRYARFECPSGAATLSLHHAETVDASGAALYFEVDNVDGAVDRLRQLGVAFEDGPTDRSWRWREAWTRDPDGRRICIYHAGPDRRFPPWRVEDEDAGATRAER